VLNRVIEGDFPCKQFVLELEDAEGERGGERKGAEERGPRVGTSELLQALVPVSSRGQAPGQQGFSGFLGTDPDHKINWGSHTL
jgi:hypothetical protein